MRHTEGQGRAGFCGEQRSGHRFARAPALPQTRVHRQTPPGGGWGAESGVPAGEPPLGTRTPRSHRPFLPEPMEEAPCSRLAAGKRAPGIAAAGWKRCSRGRSGGTRRGHSLTPLTQRAAGGRRDMRTGGRCSPPTAAGLPRDRCCGWAAAPSGMESPLAPPKFGGGLSNPPAHHFPRPVRPEPGFNPQRETGRGLDPRLIKKARPLPSTPPAAPPVRGALRQRRGAHRPLGGPGLGSPRSHPLGLTERRYRGERAEPATARAPTRSMAPRQCETQVSP